MIRTLRRAEQATPLREAGLDILVADDDPHDRLLLGLAAGDAGVNIDFSFAEDGEDLIAALEQRFVEGRRPDLVVLDIRMPRCSGIEAMELIAASESLKTTPVVMFTTSRSQNDMLRSLELGVLRFESKPSSYLALVAFTRELAEIAAGDRQMYLDLTALPSSEQ